MAKSGVIYGPTGTRKTTQAKWFAHYIARATGKATNLLSLDGGGWGPCQPEIDAGMIRPFRVDSAAAPLLFLRKLSQGFWPKDAAKGEQSELVPVDWDEVGGYVVEGWTSIAQAIMRFLPDKGINVGGEDRTKLGGFSQSITAGGQTVQEHFRSNTRGDYGFVQAMLYGIVMNFNSLPCHYVLYTALESKTEDDDRATTFGPAIAGKKATAQCGAWVGDMIHAQDYPRVREESVPDPAKPGETMKQQVVDMTVRFYFTKHIDAVTNIPFPAKPRVTPEKMAELMERFRGGYFEPDENGKNGFGEYLEFVDQMNASQGKSDALGEWRKRMDEKLGRTATAAATTTTSMK